MLDKVCVLGTEYEIDITEIKNDETDGYVSFPDKKIFIMSLDHHEHNATQVRNRVIRHELVHAFLHESGLETGCDWAGNEEVVDWIALQFPKMAEAFEKLEVMK